MGGGGCKKRESWAVLASPLSKVYVCVSLSLYENNVDVTETCDQCRKVFRPENQPVQPSGFLDSALASNV